MADLVTPEDVCMYLYELSAVSADTDTVGHIQLALAYFPQTSPAHLAELARSYPWVQSVVAANPSTPPDVLDWLTYQGTETCAVVAANPHTPEGTLRRLATSVTPWVVQDVAANPSCPSEVLADLFRSADFSVRAAVVRNANFVLPLDVTQLPEYSFHDYEFFDSSPVSYDRVSVSSQLNTLRNITMTPTARSLALRDVLGVCLEFPSFAVAAELADVCKESFDQVPLLPHVFEVLFTYTVNQLLRTRALSSAQFLTLKKFAADAGFDLSGVRPPTDPASRVSSVLRLPQKKASDAKARIKLI